jgi:germination protein M
VLAVAAVLLVAGCGDDNEATPTETATVTTPVVMTDVRAYFLRDGKVWPIARQVPKTEAAAVAALGALLAGPTDQETSDLDVSSAVSSSGFPDYDVLVGDGVAKVDAAGEWSREGLAQVVYTLTQFPTVKKVEIDGKTYTRADFEDQTPGILVESPLPFADVSSPIRATGTANTFEATFNYELTDTDGKIVDENFVTATSGTGTRGTFDFTTKKFTVPFDGVGSLVVFERSAEDGSRTKLVEIPLRMSQ